MGSEFGGKDDGAPAVEGLSEETENIPLRIVLSLLDEMFGLQKAQWVRRRMVPVLHAVIRSMFGSSINRKIIESIDAYTSPNQVADYVIMFKESFWPNGILAPAYGVRSDDCKMRTRVEAKAKLFGVLPDELKKIVGNSTARRGILRIFEMLQHPRLNKRLIYVIFEAFMIKVVNY